MRHVDDYEHGVQSEEAFNSIWMQLTQGQQFDGCFPDDFRLLVPEGAGPIADHVGNPLSWTIISDRLASHLWPLIETSVQAYSAPLYEMKSRRRIDGYKIINVTNVIDCVDKERSVPLDDEDDTVIDYAEVCIDATKAGDAHMFKYSVNTDYVSTSVICGYELVKSLVGKGFTGLAFLPCVCNEANDT